MTVCLQISGHFFIHHYHRFCQIIIKVFRFKSCDIFTFLFLVNFINDRLRTFFEIIYWYLWNNFFTTTSDLLDNFAIIILYLFQNFRSLVRKIIESFCYMSQFGFLALANQMLLLTIFTFFVDAVESLITAFVETHEANFFARRATISWLSDSGQIKNSCYFLITRSERFHSEKLFSVSMPSYLLCYVLIFKSSF